MPDSQSPSSNDQSTANQQQQQSQLPPTQAAPIVRMRRQTRYTFDQVLCGNEQTGANIKRKTLAGTSTLLPAQIDDPRKIVHEHGTQQTQVELEQPLGTNQQLTPSNNYQINSVTDLGIFQKRQKATPSTSSLPLHFDIEEYQLLPVHEKNLAPDFYQPFLNELFAALATRNFVENISQSKKPEYVFILTGSAAKQLQDSSQRNPNDIDILCKNDLQQELFSLKKLLTQMPGVAPHISDDQRGSLIITYQQKSFKLQLIDRKNAGHCFPAIEKIVINEGIIMLDAAVIPKAEADRTLADDDPSQLIQLDSIDEICSDYVRFASK